MNCNLCNQYTKLFSFHDVGSKIQEFFGSPHGSNDVLTHSAHVEINYKKIEWKHEEEIFIEVKFICSDQNDIHTMNIKNCTDMEEVESDNNYNSMVSIVNIINKLGLEIHFKGELHVRQTRNAGVFDIDPTEVLIYNVDGDSLSHIYMSVY
jgi:hypothetical protein